MVLAARRFGPGGKDVHIQLMGASIRQLKRAAEALKPLLAQFPGVSAIEDDLPWGKPEMVITLTGKGRSMGFDAASLGTQLRNAFEGAVALRFARGDDEVVVRVKRRQEGEGLAALDGLYVRSPAGVFVPLREVVNISQRDGFSLIKHDDGRRIVSVTADLDSDVMELPELTQALDEKVMPDFTARYGVEYKYSGAAEERARNFKDMGRGALVALALIYIILAWVFGNYFKPLAVMSIIPFGIVGAVYGHMLMGINLTMVSMVGLLGLSGILVNDSIILVSTAKERLDRGLSMREAATGAARDRLRAVVLTSLTTIAGLAPLMFETSRQAQFLVPMAVTMVFGLLSATILVLALVPSLLGIGSDIAALARKLRAYAQKKGSVIKAK
jgi:multidrug efflux pump subunit AcrB